MAKSKRTTTRRSAPTEATEFNPDYTDIKKDLKRIAILATSLISLLIVLSFFLR
jgi:hypothetical protein